MIGLVAGIVTVGNAVEGILAYGDMRRLIPLAIPLLALPVVLTGSADDSSQDGADSGFRYLLMPRRLLS